MAMRCAADFVWQVLLLGPCPDAACLACDGRLRAMRLAASRRLGSFAMRWSGWLGRPSAALPAALRLVS